jgi:hypothetical protein
MILKIFLQKMAKKSPNLTRIAAILNFKCMKHVASRQTFMNPDLSFPRAGPETLF